MNIRTTCPSNNKYYIRQVNGGWNGAVQGKPTKSGANVLSNCVGYANGRFAEIQGLGYIKYQLVCNAENFIEKAKAYGLKISSTPKQGGIMVWQKGNTLNSYDGAGHVAIVERVDSTNKIYTSESAYGGSAFYNATRTNNNGRWGMSSAYHFRGCIENPAIKNVKKTYSATFPKLPARGYFKYDPKKPKIIYDSGTQVRNVQKFLNWAIGANLVVDGDYGPATYNAVKAFEKAVGIRQDGLFGKDCLKKAKAYKK